MDIAELKSQARKDAFARRKLAHQNLKVDVTKPILALANPFGIIAAYMPIRTEIDPLPAMKALVREGKRLCVPVILAKGRPLEFREWREDSAMVEGAFGAQVPKDSETLIPDLVLAPLVAYDELGTRLGYGGGFYDRTLERLRKMKPTPYFGLAYSAQCALEPLPKEPTDLTLDGIITEKGLECFL